MADAPEATGTVRSFLAALERRPVPLAILAGLLIAFSLPPWGWWPLAFAGLALFDRLLAGASVRQRLGRATVVGLAMYQASTVS